MIAAVEVATLTTQFDPVPSMLAVVYSIVTSYIALSIQLFVVGRSGSRVQDYTVTPTPTTGIDILHSRYFRYLSVS
jgi:hypothetical protein